MSKRRGSPGPNGYGIAAIVAAVVVAVLLGALIVRLFSGALNLARPGGSGAPDPQFAEPAETVTRPPELNGESASGQILDDPSAGWEQVELTPVDKTAEELGREEAVED